MNDLFDETFLHCLSHYYVKKGLQKQQFIDRLYLISFSVGERQTLDVFHRYLRSIFLTVADSESKVDSAYLKITEYELINQRKNL